MLFLDAYAPEFRCASPLLEDWVRRVFDWLSAPWCPRQAPWHPRPLEPALPLVLLVPGRWARAKKMTVMVFIWNNSLRQDIPMSRRRSLVKLSSPSTKGMHKWKKPPGVGERIATNFSRRLLESAYRRSETQAKNTLSQPDKRREWTLLCTWWH